MFLAVDGVSWEAFQLARSKGLFKRFTNAGRMIAPYPSMSHPSWTEIIGTERAFGARGKLATVEARWFDLDAMRVFDDPRQVIARQASPYNYMRAFDTFFDPLIEPLMYFPGRRLFDREIEETERAILDGFTGTRFNAYVSGTDAMAHTHRNDLHAFLADVDAMIERVIPALEARGGPVDVWMVSDHGNAGAFAEGDSESYLTPVSMNPAIQRAGLVRRDTGLVLDSGSVSVVTIALASMVDMYFPDLGRRRAFADEVLKDVGVSLVTWLEVTGSARAIVVKGVGGAEAEVVWRHTNGDGAVEYAYVPLRGNPLALPTPLLSPIGATPARYNWLSDSVVRHATIDGPWPDALNRLVSSAEKRVENAPDLIVNLSDGYAHDGDFGRTVRMVRTHGSLSARATFGIVASTRSAVPSHVRASEVLGLMHLAPREMLPDADALHSLNADSLVRALSRTSPAMATGHADHSADADFLRRAHPVVQSIGYLDWPRLRGLQSLLPKDAGNGNASFDWQKAFRTAKRTDVLAGLARGVDTLLALADSLDPAALDERLAVAADRLRGIPELSPLAEVYDDVQRSKKAGSAATRDGGGAGVRSAAMLAWTLPYFLNAALDLPELDSIPDTRDRAFAVDWRRSRASGIRRDPSRVFGTSTVASTLFSQVFAERTLWQRTEPATIPLVYDPELGDITVVLVPGIYGELFDGELWQRGMRAVRERLGVRTFTVRADGRCSSAINAGTLRRALHDDTRRRLERGYATPRYLLIGYSKGGIDATEALLADSLLSATQIAALVTVATPHLGSPVVERAEMPAALLKWASRDTIPTACVTDGAAPSLFPATRRAFWADHAEAVSSRTRLFSVAFVSDVHEAHPWMKITKQVGQFTEPNDGVVALSAARFPAEVPAVHLGTIQGDHIAGINASSFPQEAFLESIVLTLGELGALDRSRDAAWRDAQRAWLTSPVHRASAASRAPAFAGSLRPRSALPGGSAGWTPTATFRLLEASSVQDRGIRAMSPTEHPDGYGLRCDQRDLGEFRREYEFIYDAGNGGREGDLLDGFSMVADKGSSSGRACHLATSQSAIKMTSVSLRFKPADYPALRMRLRVPVNVRGVDPSLARRGASDAAFKLWFVVRDTRPGVANATRLFGYTWSAPNRDGQTPADNALVEAVSSRRSLVVTTLPEAWLITVGNPAAGAEWQLLTRNLAADLTRAYPTVPIGAFEVVGVTIQSDSDESKGKTEVYVDEISFRPGGKP